MILRIIFLITIFPSVAFGVIGLPLEPKEDNPPACLVEKIPDCICIQVYMPVCGCNKKTYGNSCAARCDGVTSWTPGSCAFEDNNGDSNDPKGETNHE